MKDGIISSMEDKRAGLSMTKTEFASRIGTSPAIYTKITSDGYPHSITLPMVLRYAREFGGFNIKNLLTKGIDNESGEERKVTGEAAV